MRDAVSTTEMRPIYGQVAQTWARVPDRPRLTVLGVTEESPRTDNELRSRLLYWIRRGMTREGLTQAEFARAIGAPASTVSRWLKDDELAVPGITWLGAICRAPRLDPMLFARLDPIPVDPLDAFALGEDSDLLVVTDAARLAQLDAIEAEEAVQLAVSEPSEPPRRRSRRGARQCPPGRRDR